MLDKIAAAKPTRNTAGTVEHASLLDKLTLNRSVLLGRTILLILSSVLLSGLLSAGIYEVVAQRVYANIRVQELVPVARTVADILSNWNADGGGRRGPRALLREADNSFGATLYVFDADGRQVRYDRSPQRGPGSGGSGPAAGLIAADLPEILAGNEVSSVQRTGDGSDFLIVGVPIESGGAVVFTRSMADLTDSVRGLNNTLLISSLVSAGVMLIPAYFLTRKLVTPIRQMRNVAQAMAHGDFSQRADDAGSGEIAELGASMNYFAVESERLQQTRQDYVANVSHELRTPIAAIRAMGETLQDGMVSSDEKRQLFYGNIVRESMRLSRLVDDLLELSRLQSGNAALTKESFDMRVVLQDIVDGYGHLAEDAGLRFSIAADMRNPIMAFSNPDRVEQVLVTLMDNAIKHAVGHGAITLTCQAEIDHVVLSVTNMGEPIPSEDLPYIFERFYTVNKSRSEGGTGLGLSIAKEIVQGLDEQIWVTSDSDSTSFHFTVQRAR